MKKIILLTLISLFAVTINAKTYDIQKLGADIKGKKKCTELINKTIQQASAEGGGTIYFPAGEYLTAAIKMESNITLHLESGAIINFSEDFEDYLPFVDVRWEGTFMKTFQPLIYARDAENITITGRGTLNGKGHVWWNRIREIGQEVRDNGKVKEPDKLQKIWKEQNPDVVVEDYYKRTIESLFFRPPFIQFLECNNIRIEGISIINSPFWTINPVGCNNILIHGITINNPSENPKGPNTDGVNPSSCRNVRISDCFISAGDDCITIKSGRDANGRKYGHPCENITITNCVMLSGHGGVVIGSEMSGGVKKITISNCVFNGTDNGIRLKASRGRGGVVEEIRVNNIVMNGIRRDAFIFDLFYDKSSVKEPVTERTPVFRNIHISNITGNEINRVGYITGIEEMPIDEISFSNINMSAKEGFKVKTASNIRLYNVDYSVEKGAAFSFTDAENIILDNVRSKYPLPNQAVVEVENAKNVLINNCFQVNPTDLFYKSTNSEIILGNNFMQHVKMVKAE
jgi:Endopolygalacturonase